MLFRSHFRTVSDDDLNQAQYLRKELDGLLAEKEQPSDSKTLQSLNTQITQLLKPMAAQIHVPTISPLVFDSLFRSTGSLKSVQNIQKLQLIPYDDILKVTQSVVSCINLASSMASTPCSKSVENNSLSLNKDKGTGRRGRGVLRRRLPPAARDCEIGRASCRERV